MGRVQQKHCKCSSINVKTGPTSSYQKSWNNCRTQVRCAYCGADFCENYYEYLGHAGLHCTKWDSDADKKLYGKWNSPTFMSAYEKRELKDDSEYIKNTLGKKFVQWIICH